MMNGSSTQPTLSKILPPLILGGAGFSYQTHPDPYSLPVREVIKQAFDHDMLAIDTSPFYEPSEELLGEAQPHPSITSEYSRSNYILMTKVGRLGADQFDYSPAWIRQSVERSLHRLRTSYLDVVFCHDVEFVTDEDTLTAVGELLNLVAQGKVRYVGLSSYRIDILARV
jgi:D-arabinose 1-dehydrogenase